MAELPDASRVLPGASRPSARSRLRGGQDVEGGRGLAPPAIATGVQNRPRPVQRPIVPLFDVTCVWSIQAGVGLLPQWPPMTSMM
jgi:hypothetical protein